MSSIVYLNYVMDNGQARSDHEVRLHRYEAIEGLNEIYVLLCSQHFHLYLFRRKQSSLMRYRNLATILESLCAAGGIRSWLTFQNGCTVARACCISIYVEYQNENLPLVILYFHHSCVNCSDNLAVNRWPVHGIILKVWYLTRYLESMRAITWFSLRCFVTLSEKRESSRAWM